MKITTTLATCRTPEGAQLLLQLHDGQYYLRIDGVQLMSTTASSSEQQMADIACANLSASPSILIGGLGFGFTLRRVLEICGTDANVEVAELLDVIIDWNRTFLKELNGHLIDDPRVKIHLGDVSEKIDQAGTARYHAILLDVDNSPDPLVQKGNARLYSRDGIKQIRAALQPGGRVVFWSANADRRFAASLGKVFNRVECISAKAYPKARRATHTLFIADRD